MMQPVDYKTPIEDTGRERLYNFSAGPGVLPESVLMEVRSELPVYKNIGASILEISHRSPEYTEVMTSATERLRRLLGLPEAWHVLYLQGGASLQFYQVPLNFLPKDGTADYLVTGAWAKKALKEAQGIGGGTRGRKQRRSEFLVHSRAVRLGSRFESRVPALYVQQYDLRHPVP